MVKDRVLNLSRWSMQFLQFADYLSIFALFWLLILSFYLLRTIRRIEKITQGTKAVSLDQILEGILTRQGQDARQIADIVAKIENITGSQKKFFTKHALIRFNPFEDTGGDQSFALSLLDGQNNGIVISSLHSRTQTRLYAKLVSGAKPQNHPFSKEEKEVVEKAARQG